MFILVNKNYLVPTILSYTFKTQAIDELLNITISRTREYCMNVYVVNGDDEIYYFECDKIFCQKNSTLSVVYEHVPTKWMGNTYLSHYKEQNEIKQLETLNLTQNDELKGLKFTDDETKQMNISIDLKKECASNNTDKKKVLFLNDKLSEKVNELNSAQKILQTQEVSSTQEVLQTQKILPTQEVSSAQEVSSIQVNTDSEFDEKRNKLIGLIEEVNGLYQKELVNIRRLELNLKSFDNKLNKLEKKKKEEIFDNVIKTQTEYRTWKKIKYTIEDDIDILKPESELVETNKEAPILFLSKFKYIDKILENDAIKQIFNDLNSIDLNEIYSQNILPNENIIQFCNKYAKLSKELHYKFDHDWDHLEEEMNLNSTNRLSTSNISSSSTFKK